jgi:hypothetical protein
MTIQEIENKLIEYVAQKENRDTPIHILKLSTAVDFIEEFLNKYKEPDEDEYGRLYKLKLVTLSGGAKAGSLGVNNSNNLYVMDRHEPKFYRAWNHKLVAPYGVSNAREDVIGAGDYFYTNGEVYKCEAASGDYVYSEDIQHNKYLCFKVYVHPHQFDYEELVTYEKKDGSVFRAKKTDDDKVTLNINLK